MTTKKDKHDEDETKPPKGGKKSEPETPVRHDGIEDRQGNP